MTHIACVLASQAGLGEGPCWDGDAQCLWWLDIFAQAIHRYDPKTGHNETIHTPARPGSLALRRSGDLVVAMGDGFFAFDRAKTEFTPVAMVESHLPMTRMNDGRTDRQGRFWAGSVCEDTPPRPLGALYRLDADLRCHKMVEHIGCSNGLAWSPDGKTMYHTDSHGPLIWAWDYDIGSGGIENSRVFVDLTSIDAVADGATVDCEGCFWVALPFKGQVHRYDPSGKLMRSITMPVDAPTCCEFGGDALDVLYVTSGTLGRSAKDLEDQPLAGALFAIDVGVKGLPAAAFAG